MPDLPDLPPIAGAKGFIHSVGDAPAYWMQDILWIMLADRDDTDGRWSIMEQLMHKGAGPPLHKHLWSDETFYILDGSITFLIDGEIRTAKTGAFVSVAHNTRHAFRVDSNTARILNGYTPASMEALIAELGKHTNQRTLPPQGPVATPGQIPDELLTRYGLVWLAEPDPLAPRSHERKTSHD